MSAGDDLNTTAKGQALTAGQFVAVMTAPGRTVSSTASPKGTVVSNIGTTSIQAIAASTTRRGIEFHSANPSGVNMWVMPGNLSAAINQGMLVVPGGHRRIPHSLAANAAFNVIALSGATSVLTVVEFF